MSNYKKSSSPVTSGGPVRLNSGWGVKSSSHCAVTCQAKYPPCYTFMYNKTTRHCTPGSTISNTSPPPTSSEGTLYVRSLSCEVTLGFTLVTYNTTTACLHVRRDIARNYTQAVAVCQAENSFLISLKTEEKVRLLNQVTYGADLWVGCNDIENEGSFVWMEDGAPATKSWLTGYPSGGTVNDCCVYYTHAMGLADQNCATQYSFVCEQSMF